jgi:hypothetical protein
MPNRYALVVGIDSYPPESRVPPLFGCRNDANAMADFLAQRFTAPPFQIKTLLDAEATRDHVIEGFRTHLAQAQAGDVALFFYAGHGSEEEASGLDKENETDGRNQTTVLYDSRLPNGEDLLDKHLRQLLDEVSERGVHMTVVLDCCHSGSGTRDLAATATRKAPPRTRTSPPQPLPPPPSPATRKAGLASGDIWATLAAAASAAAQAPRPPAIPSIPAVAAPPLAASGSHINLAACENYESANEYPVGDQHHGAFTYFLLQELTSSSTLPNYIELLQRVRPRLQAQVSQNPLVEAIGGDTALRNTFLGTAPNLSAEVQRAVFTFERTWQIDAGATSNLTPGDSVALYPLDAASATLADLTAALATAKVASVTPGASTLTLLGSSQLDPAITYAAVLTARAATLPVQLVGDPSGQQLLRDALAGSLSLKEAAPGQNPRLIVVADGERFTIAAPMIRNRMPGSFPQTGADAALVLRALTHMARWILQLELHNPVSQMSGNLVGLTVQQPGMPDQPCPPLTRLELAYPPGSDQEPSFKLCIANRSQQPLHVALLAFDQDWSIDCGLLAAGCQRLAPGEFVFPYSDQRSGEPIPACVAPPAVEALDQLLLIASTDPFDPHALEQGPLTVESTRSLGKPPAPKPLIHDFLTRRLQVHTVRPA